MAAYYKDPVRSNPKLAAGCSTVCNADRYYYAAYLHLYKICED